MKKLIYILLTLSIFYGCQEDKEVGFDITIPQENISFQPTAGGAIMRYRLPADPDILSIRVRYQDAFGKKYYERVVMLVILYFSRIQRSPARSSGVDHSLQSK
ncbi:MAG: hypothetical protein ACLU4N_05795 [Butyricimonas faecihominis]